METAMMNGATLCNINMIPAYIIYKKAGYYCPPDAPFLTTSNKKPSCDGAVPVSLTVHSQTPALRVEEAATPYLIVPEGPLPSREVLLRGPTTTR
ncbi:hypothetical protein K1T71_005215 [Dendrolimus kikuchii]|uniref:Uncharacterized protein n=1 Tax=Dendrolimus kikuchii TaxID=765133 RepID=A0ACC1D7D6_9NEOP|nr:hypothetical protein K1T71_005215 [Dendrolimus kikuchii]